MKKLILVVLLSVPTFVLAQTVLWSEDFLGEANGATSGIAAGTPGGTWSVTTFPSSGTFSRQTLPIVNEIFRVNLTGVNEGVWESNSIDISGTGMATVTVDLSTSFTAATDYLRAYYKVDGGAEILFAELLGQPLNLTVNGSAIASGSTLEVVIRGKENTNFFGLSTLSFDNVVVTTVPAVYSRKNGVWTDNTIGDATWSAVALGGISCDCAPTTGQVAVIGNNNTVTLPISSNQSVGGVNIVNTGILQYNNNASTVTVVMGLFKVESGGTVNSSGAGITGEQIIFNADVGGANFQVDGTASIQDLVLSTNASNLHFMTGGGSLTITGDILINASGATLTNNLTTSPTFGASSRILFGQTGAITVSTFTNNQALSLPSIVVNDNADDNNIVNNTSTLALTGATSINPTSADFFINNSGTINQAGNFAGLVAASNFVNQTGGTWNWSLTPNAPLDANLPNVLVCTAANNTFNYNGAGAQSIAAITYHHLTTSSSGTKTLGGAVTVNGNLSITNTSILDPLTFNLTANGTTSITGGSFNDSNDTGTDIFVGNVSVAATTSFISTSVTTTGNLVFRGGIANAGTFTAGGATFNTNNQAITGSAAMSFANAVAINNFTVTNSNAGAFTITGTTTLTNGGYTDNDNTSVATFGGLVSQTGTSAFNTTAVSTQTNLIFRGGITNNGGTFTAGGATFNTASQAIGGNTAVSFANVLDISSVTVTNNNTGGVSLTSNGSSLTGAAGTWTQGGGGSILNFAGSSIAVNTFNTSTATNTVNYNSTGTAQAIRRPSSASTYSNLTFNNTFATPPQLTLAAASNITVSGVLTMTAGRVSISSNVTLSSNAAGALVHGLTSASGWMYGSGSIVRAVTGSFAVGIARGLFPLGSDTNFRPFFIVKGGAASSGNITVSHTNATTTSNPVSITDGAATIIIRHDAFWTVASTLGAGTFGVRYGGTGLGAVTNLAHLRSCLTASVITASTHVGATTVSVTDPRVERSAITFGRLANSYYVGSTNVASPLPIKLLYFNASVEQDKVNLNWATAQELNNDFFTIEKSLNPEQGFQPVLDVAGQGNSNVKQEYYAVDKAPYAGLSYYRLKQTDFDGKYTYSDLVAVSYEGSTLPSLSVYPNPLKQKQSIKVEITGLMGMTHVPLVIYNSIGQKIIEETIEVSQSGIVQKEYFFENPLSAGVFIVKAGPTLQLTQRLVVE